MAAKLAAHAERARELQRRSLVIAEQDIQAYARVREAGGGAERARALTEASEPPLAMTELAAELAETATDVAKIGSWAFVADLHAASELAAGGARASYRLVEANLVDRPGDNRLTQARLAVVRAEQASQAADRLDPSE